MNVHAVLIDTVSIQRYVFGSNKLKEILGASHLIKEVYSSHLKEILQIDDDRYSAWRENPCSIEIRKPETPVEVGYIGGGNALLFFKQKDTAEKFIKDWTKRLLIETPGIVTAIASDIFDLDNFQTESRKLFSLLRKNKAEVIPQTIIPRHGITSECSHSGYSMDIWNETLPKKPEYVSAAANAKITAAEYAKKDIEHAYTDILGDDYCFTDELDRLGQNSGHDSHIAIVYIDGNGMGKRFQEMETLEDLRALSASVEKATQNSFRSLLNNIIGEISKLEEFLEIRRENGKKILPIRPVIIGGDDIVFVSEGRMGIYFAKLFIEAFEKQSVTDNKPLTACAGIAITKTKYPFYRSYSLSEELCKNSKTVRKAKKDLYSWLDFHIAYGGFSGSLEEIREANYRITNRDLLMRPYRIGGEGDSLSFETLVAKTTELKKILPHSKIKELRLALTQGDDVINAFVNETAARTRDITKIAGNVFENSKTPYFDMIEFMEVYPFEARKGGEEK